MLRATLKLCAIQFVIYFSLNSHAQDAFPATGGTASGTDGTINYTIGQVAYSNHSELDGSISEGVQQPFEINVLSDLSDAGKIDLAFEAFPNPSNDKLFIEIQDYDLSEVRYQLYTIAGELIESHVITDSLTEIDMTLKNAGSYILNIIENQDLLKSFVIAKPH